MAPQQQHMLAWCFILLWLTVYQALPSLSFYSSLCIPYIFLIMSISLLSPHLFFHFPSVCIRLCNNLSFSCRPWIPLSLILYFSSFAFEPILLIFSVCLSSTSLLCIPLVPLLQYVFFSVIISASLFFIQPPMPPLFPPLPLPPTLWWRGVNMSSTCGFIVPSQQSKTTTLKLLNRLHQMTSASSLLLSIALFPLRVEMLNNHEAMPGRQD